jgi:hypothetical protein
MNRYRRIGDASKILRTALTRSGIVLVDSAGKRLGVAVYRDDEGAERGGLTLAEAASALDISQMTVLPGSAMECFPRTSSAKARLG